MFRQIRIICSVLLRGFFGINEAMYSRDCSKRRRAKLMIFTFILVGVVIAVYIVTLSLSLVNMGMPDMIPAYLFALTSLLILFLSIFLAGETVFNMQTYEKLIVLPVKPSAIIISRFLTVYVLNEAMSILVMISGCCVYASTVKPDTFFYFEAILGTLILPLIPLTLATVISAAILIISSRMKHIKIVRTVLSMIIMLLIVSGSFFLSSQSVNLTEQAYNNIIVDAFSKICNVYPPAKLFSLSVTNKDHLSFLLLVFISIALFSVFVFVIKKFFVSICTLLSSSTAKKQFKMSEQKSSSVLKALYKKELKRYFSSNIYIMNTSLGYLLSIVLSVSVMIMGFDRISSLLGIEGVIQKAAPIIIALLCVIATPTSCSISLEGKQWWIAQTLPVTAKSVYLSKLFVGFTISIPSIIAELLMCIAVRADFLNSLAIVLFPTSYVVFSNIVGLYFNIKIPLLNWVSETTPVKQGGSVLISMLVGFVSVGIPAAAVFVLPKQFTMPIMFSTCAVICIISVLVMRACFKTKLMSIH